jgi:hypothetical protein
MIGLLDRGAGFSFVRVMRIIVVTTSAWIVFFVGLRPLVTASLLSSVSLLAVTSNNASVTPTTAPTTMTSLSPTLAYADYTLIDVVSDQESGFGFSVALEDGGLLAVGSPEAS